MASMRRWINARRKVVWSEPELPPYVKINPRADPSLVDTVQPGDVSMGAIARDFLDAPETEEQPP